MRRVYVVIFAFFALLEGFIALTLLWDGRWWFVGGWWGGWPWWLYAAAAFIFGSLAIHEVRRTR